jgi:ASC-1-like (ASCH) protein
MKVTPRQAVLIGTVLLIILFLVLYTYFYFATDPNYSGDSDGLGNLLAIAVYLAFTLGGVAIALSYYSERVRQRGAWQRLETYLHGGKKEKILHRELAAWEQYFLEQKYKKTKNKNFDLDRRAPVFKIQGRVVKLPRGGSKLLKLKEEWNVRGFVINETNYPDIKYKHFKKGEELTVEFSPYSKWVWDVYRIVAEKRNWLMNLYSESFESLKSGKTNVIARAPYGSHRLETMRSGDLITFTNASATKHGLSPNVTVRVENVSHYSNPEAMLESEGLENVYPNERSIESAVEKLNSLYSYRERVKKGGVYAIRVSPL